MEWFYVCNLLFTIIYILIKFCSGGQGNTLTFLTDESFSLALMTILKKDKKKLQVTVKFDMDMMLGYRIQHLVCSLSLHQCSYIHVDI